jgi:hypothetical protein
MELFDPCTVVPDEAIRAAGADPAVVGDSLLGASNDDRFAPCVWAAGSHYLTVTSSTSGLDAIVEDSRYVTRSPVPIAGREGAYSLVRPDPLGTAPCDVVFAWARGIVMVTADRRVGAPVGDDDTCALALFAANTFNPYLPK